MKKLTWRYIRNKFWWPVLWKYSDIKYQLYRRLTYEHKYSYSYKTFKPKEKFSTDTTVYVTERKWVWENIRVWWNW